MSIPKSVKVALALLACILCICSLCYACTSALIQKILPDNPGSRDWRYVLHNGYEIWHLNSSHIVLVKDGWSEYTNTVVDTHIVLFCYSDEYIGLQCTDPQTNADAAEAADLEYFLVNTVETKLLGPFAEAEYQEFCKAEGITGLSEWIRTSPPPDGATY